MVREKKKRGPKGIPDNLVDLYQAGKRIRFHGFWLGKSKADRMIADWLDEMPNAAAAVKLVLYAHIRGGGHLPTPSQDFGDDLDIGAGAKALLGLDD
jgi:hypothetical protein